jgi:hypothetical protein
VSVARLPVLVVVSGPMGSGKTTLAHMIARSAGCPAICRDEIKEGMVHTVPGFLAGPGDELTMRTLPVRSHRAFDRPSLDAPWIEVDTTDGYVPDLEEIVAFAVGRE